MRKKNAPHKLEKKSKKPLNRNVCLESHRLNLSQWRHVLKRDLEEREVVDFLGSVCVSVEILPKSLAEAQPAGNVDAMRRAPCRAAGKGALPRWPGPRSGDVATIF